MQKFPAVLSTADVGISPDPKNPLNDLSTMNKTMEYMAFGLPVVAFDLRETRVSAGDAGVYATPNDVGELARLLVELVDRRTRAACNGNGRARCGSNRNWGGNIKPLATWECTSSSPRPVDVASPSQLEPDSCAGLQAPTSR